MSSDYEVTLEDAQKVCGINRETLEKMIDSQLLPYVLNGNIKFIQRKYVEVLKVLNTSPSSRPQNPKRPKNNVWLFDRLCDVLLERSDSQNRHEKEGVNLGQKDYSWSEEYVIDSLDVTKDKLYELVADGVIKVERGKFSSTQVLNYAIFELGLCYVECIYVDDLNGEFGDVLLWECTINGQMYKYDLGFRPPGYVSKTKGFVSLEEARVLTKGATKMGEPYLLGVIPSKSGLNDQK